VLGEGLMNVGKVLAQCAQKFPDKTALIFSQEEMSFKKINLMANRMSNKLRQLGIKRGDRVALMLPNSSSFVISYFGILKLGAVCVPLDIRFKGEEIRGIIENAQIKVFITSSELNEYCAPLLKKLRHAIIMVIVGIESHGKQDETITFEEIMGDETLSEAGTTGRPKGVVLTFNNLGFFPETLSKLYGTNDNDVIGCILPMSHLSGPILCNELVDKGCSLVIFDQLRPDKVLVAVEKHRVTWFHAVPPVFQAILRVPHLNEYDLSSLRFIAMMGTSIPFDLLKRFKKTFPSVVVVQGYGLSETSPFITLVPPEYEQKKMGSIGLPVPHAEVKLVMNGKGEEVPCGEVGELMVKGPMVMKEYHNNVELTRERIKDGWFYTGDLCKKDEDGFYYYLSRKDDMIIVGGLNVFPFEVESILLSHPQVLEVAAVGVPDEERGEIIKAVVVLKPGSNLTKKDLISYCRGRLADYKIPKIVEFWDSIPKTSTGKVARKLLINETPETSNMLASN
jgi:long-chain acyl-CoA synthetase